MLLDSTFVWDRSTSSYVKARLPEVFSVIPAVFSEIPKGYSILKHALSNPTLYLKLLTELQQLLTQPSIKGMTWSTVEQTFPVDIKEYMTDVHMLQTQQITPPVFNIPVEPVTLLEIFIDTVFACVTAIIVYLVFGMALQHIFPTELTVTVCLIIACWILSVFITVGTVYNLVKDFIITLFRDGIFSAIVFLMLELVPKILVIIFCKILDILRFLYYIPFGIGQKIQEARNRLWAWAVGTSPTREEIRIYTVRAIALTLLCFTFLFTLVNKNVGVEMLATRLKVDRKIASVATCVIVAVIIGSIAEILS